MDPADLNVFDSDEDGVVEDIALRRQPKVFKNRPNYFEEYDGLEFFKRFRLKKQTCTMVLNSIEDQIKSTTDRNRAISPSTKLLLTLRFYATGSMLIAAGDFVGVSKTSACNIITNVTEAITTLRGRYIKFSETQAQQQKTKENFYEIARFPHVIGVIDCSHIRIQSPGGDEAERYRNRKGYFAWNVQTICDAHLRIMDIVARWPGSTHDQTIFNNSRIKGRLLNNELGATSLILGDSGYDNTNFLITPLERPATPAEILFSESYIRTRNSVERSYGVWKRRFPILSLGMRLSLEHSKAIIVATAILHTIAIEEREAQPPNEFEEEDVPEDLLEDHNRVAVQANNRMRMLLINNHFANLL